MKHVLVIVTIRWGKGTGVNVHIACQYQCTGNFIWVEACKFEQCSYVKTVVFCGRNACKCEAELCEALDDHALPY